MWLVWDRHCMRSKEASGRWGKGGSEDMVARKGVGRLSQLWRPEWAKVWGKIQGRPRGTGGEPRWGVGGEGAEGLLHSAVFTLLLNLRKQNGCSSQPAPSVTSSDTNCPGLKKKKKRESPHYMVGNPQTRDKILWVAYCSTPRIFDIPCFTYSILNTWDTGITVCFIFLFFYPFIFFFFLSWLSG